MAALLTKPFLCHHKAIPEAVQSLARRNAALRPLISVKRSIHYAVTIFSYRLFWRPVVILY